MPSSIAHVATGTPVGGVNGGTTSGVDTTGANFIALWYAWYQPTVEPVVTDSKSNAYTYLAIQSSGSGGINFRMAYVHSPTVGTGHTWTVSGSGTYSIIGALAFSGVLTSAALDQQNGATSTSTTSIAHGSVTPSEGNEVLLTGVTWQNSGTQAIGSGYTLAAQTDWTANNWGLAMAYLIQGTASAVNGTWSRGGTAGHACAKVATYKSSGGPPTGGISFLTLLGVG